MIWAVRSTPASYDAHQFVYIIKLVFLTVVNLVKQAWLFPQSLVVMLKEGRQQLTLDAEEVERLDRIRNPSKYLGK